MDIDANTKLSDFQNIEKIFEHVRAIRAKNPEASLFIASLDIQPRRDGEVGTDQFVVADNANAFTFLTIAALALDAAQSAIIETVKQHPEAVIEAGSLAAAAKAAQQLINAATGQKTVVGRKEVINKGDLADADIIGPVVGRA